MNNKGFAVSSILYTILICFLMFLGAAMAMFSASNGLVVAANDDIINGTTLKAARVIVHDDVCSGTSFDQTKFNEPSIGNNILIKISSRYGTKYWPKDFMGTTTNGKLQVNIPGGTNVQSHFGNSLKIKDTITTKEVSVDIKDPCN